MSENKNPIRNGIIVTVVGGLILAALLKLVPSLCGKLLNLLKYSWTFLFFRIELSVWLFFLLLIPSFYLLFKLAKKILPTTHKNIKPINASCEIQKPASTEKRENKKVVFLEEEKYILALLAETDGRALNLSEIATALECTNIRTEHAAEQLEKKGLIRYSSFANVYDLTSAGRELIVKNGWDKKLKKST